MIMPNTVDIYLSVYFAKHLPYRKIFPIAIFSPIIFIVPKLFGQGSFLL